MRKSSCRGRLASGRGTLNVGQVFLTCRAGSWLLLGLNVDGVITNHPEFTTEGATVMSMPAYEPVPHAQMIYMPDFRGRRFAAGGIMPTFDLMHNFFLRTGFYAMFREKRSFVPRGVGPGGR